MKKFNNKISKKLKQKLCSQARKKKMGLDRFRLITFILSTKQKKQQEQIPQYLFSINRI